MNFKKRTFFDGNSEWEDLGGGVSRQFVGYNSQVMMVIVKFEKDAIELCISIFIPKLHMLLPENLK
ncbi:hypothetical protein [Chryseobacterium indoltheticum]|uniref:hypothetical protein n=1 Tax=Chryseobacterium indoltheticum TaxID=254 RepID=UPI003F497999